MDIAFGPVPSRRLGRSLGINNIPPKHCSYSCVYCQVGVTRQQKIIPRPFFPPEEIFRQVTQRLAAVLARGEPVDFLTFVPDGEPTLDAWLDEAIDALRGLGRPIAVISNASLLWRPDVRAALSRADWVSVKVDSVDEAIWRRVNRPHPDLRLADVLAGIRAFASEFHGTLVSETMLLAGVNDDAAGVEAVGRFLLESGVARAYLAMPHRPPAEAWARAPEAATLVGAYQALAGLGVPVELLAEHEGEDFAYTGDLQRDILATAAVHPLREAALRALVAKAGGDPAPVRGLIESGALQRVDHAGETYYVRHWRHGD
jgi:wyosine [tRNA(Phe)-imidazoG37] synthetase (radical SAM superfamily)